jgi:hypothetical protein
MRTSMNVNSFGAATAAGVELRERAMDRTARRTARIDDVEDELTAALVCSCRLLLIRIWCMRCRQTNARLLNPPSIDMTPEWLTGAGVRAELRTAAY